MSHLEDMGECRLTIPDDREKRAQSCKVAQMCMDTATELIARAWELDPTLAGIMPAVPTMPAETQHSVHQVMRIKVSR